MKLRFAKNDVGSEGRGLRVNVSSAWIGRAWSAQERATETPDGGARGRCGLRCSPAPLPEGRPMPRLINASKSRRGWSRIGNFILCEYLAGAIERGAILGSRDALNKGSLGHAGQAHLHTIEGVEHGPVLVNGELVEDASDFATPEQAIVMLANSELEYRPFKEEILEIHKGYMQKRMEGAGHAIMVEQEMIGVIGECDGESGLHLVADDQWDLLDPREDNPTPPKTLKAFSGRTINVVPLDVPGHPRHGWPIYISRRLDLVRRKGKYGEIIVEDHKFKARIRGGSSKHAYRADGGFVAIDVLCRQRFTWEYGGIWLNLISTNPSSYGEQNRFKLPPARDKELKFPYTLWYRENEFAKMQVKAMTGELPYEYWPDRSAENGANCVSRYGKCFLYDHCYKNVPLRFK
jgi:hypothetical protein